MPLLAFPLALGQRLLQFLGLEFDDVGLAGIGFLLVLDLLLEQLTPWACWLMRICPIRSRAPTS